MLITVRASSWCRLLSAVRWPLQHGYTYILGFLLVYCLAHGLSYLPSLLMSHHVEQDGITLVSDARLPENPAEIINGVISRIQRSELYQPNRQIHVHLCNSRLLYCVASWFSWNTRGTYQRITGQIMINMTSIYGREDLAGCIAHEITHDMVRKHLGRRVADLPEWVSEGYAEHVAYGRWPIWLAHEKVKQLRAGELARDDYSCYRLMVAYALEAQQIPLEVLLRKPPPAEELLSALTTRPFGRVIGTLTGIHGNDRWYD